jgi:hypothetical protein
MLVARRQYHVERNPGSRRLQELATLVDSGYPNFQVFHDWVYHTFGEEALRTLHAPFEKEIIIIISNGEGTVPIISLSVAEFQWV